MAKKNKHIDDLFKEGLKGNELPLDGSEWGRLFDELHPPKKKRFVWWWFALPGVLLSAVLVFFLMPEKTKDVDGASTNQVVSTQTPNSIADNSDQTTKSASIEKIEEENSVENEVQNIESEVAKSVESNSGGSSRQTSSAPGISEDNRTSERKELEVSTSRAPYVVLSMSSITGVNLSLENPLSPMISLPFGLGYPAVSIDTNNPASEYIMKGRFISLGGGANRWSQQLESNDNKYLELRGKNENTVILPDFSIDYQHDFAKFRFNTGGAFTTKGQANSRDFTYEIYDSLPYVDQNGQRTWLPYNYRDTTVSGLNSPRYQYVRLPIGLSYPVRLSDRAELDLGVNTSLQILTGGTGFILGNGLKPQNVQQLGGFNRLQVGLGGSVGFGYAVTRQTKLRISATYSGDLSDMNRSANNSQRFNGLGLNAAVQFNIKKK